MEAVRLRSQDIDYQILQISIYSGKSGKDRFSTFPALIIPVLNNHLSKVKILHDQGIKEGYGSVYLPYVLGRKYPNAEKQFNWQYIFPSRNLSTDPRSGKVRRHHVDPSVVNKAIKSAVRKIEINKNVSAHTFRHSLATIYWNEAPI